MDTCSTYLVPSGEGEFLRLNAFSQFCKARTTADSLPFAFPSAVMNAQVVMLSPNPAEVANFLYMLINHLQRLTLTALSNVHRKPAMGWGEVQVRCTEC